MFLAMALWRVGDVLMEVSTDVLVPEMIREEQYQQAASVRTSVFFAGCAFGCVFLHLFADAGAWAMYVLLFLVLLGASIPALKLLNADYPRAFTDQEKSQHRLAFSWHAFKESFMVPMSYEGGFPCSCVAALAFSLGTCPLFFQLLIVRDIGGVNIDSEQDVFSFVVALVFFLCAIAGASSCGAVRELPLEVPKHLMLQVLCAGVGISSFLIPCCGLMHKKNLNVIFLTLNTCFYGFCFGGACSRFQDVTWKLLPPTAKWANAMGVQLMFRHVGIAIGCFIGGCVLSFFTIGRADLNDPAYLQNGFIGLDGYFSIAGLCVAAILFCAKLMLEAQQLGRPVHDKKATISMTD